MDMKMLGNGTKFDLPAIIKDPFRQDKIKQMWFHWYASDGMWGGWVEFQNGQTSGKQELMKDPSLDGLVAQIKAIVLTIQNKSA